MGNAGLNTNRVWMLDQTAAGTAVTGYCHDASDRVLGSVGAGAVTDVKYDLRGNTTEFTSGGSTTYLSWDEVDRNLGARSVGADPADMSYQRDVTDRFFRRGATQGASTWWSNSINKRGIGWQGRTVVKFATAFPGAAKGTYCCFEKCLF